MGWSRNSACRLVAGRVIRSCAEEDLAAISNGRKRRPPLDQHSCNNVALDDIPTLTKVNCGDNQRGALFAPAISLRSSILFPKEKSDGSVNAFTFESLLVGYCFLTPTRCAVSQNGARNVHDRPLPHRCRHSGFAFGREAAQQPQGVGCLGSCNACLYACG
jgi:hypothetical protein